jgi:hypothetical protein
MAISFVQAAQYYSSASVSTLPIAYTSNVTAGDLLVVTAVVHVTAAQTISGIADTQGNVWTPCEAAQSLVLSSNTYLTQTWYAVAKTTGANTVTVTPSAAVTFSGITVAEYSGGAGTWTLDQAASSAETSTFHLITGPPVTTAQASVLVHGVLLDGYSTGWDATGSTYNCRTPSGTAVQVGFAQVDLLNQAAGTYSPTVGQAATTAGTAVGGTTHTFYLVTSSSLGPKVGQPVPMTETNFAGYTLPISSQTTSGRAGQPVPVVFTDLNGNEYTVTGPSKGAFIGGAVPVVLCDITGHPIVPPIVLTSNGNTASISSTLTGNKLGKPKPVVLTDANGNTLGQSGFSYGSMAGNPTPCVLTDVNGNVITLTMAT